MTAAWPASVTQRASRARFDEQMDQAVAEFSPAVGDRQLRERTRIDSDQINFTSVLSGDEVEDLRTFYSSTIGDGTLPFTRTHPRTGLSATFVFTEPPQFNEIGPDTFRATMSIRKMP